MGHPFTTSVLTESMNPESLISSTAIQILQNFSFYNNTDQK